MMGAYMCENIVNFCLVNLLDMLAPLDAEDQILV
jgi:hypothetical protein